MVEQLLQTIVELLKPSRQRLLLLSSPSDATDGTESFEKYFPTTIQAPVGRSLEIALLAVRTSNSWPNIDSRNNFFEYSNALTTKAFSLPIGSYEIETINENIQRIMKSNNDWDEENQSYYVTLSANFATLKAVIEITHDDYKVNIGGSSLRTVLGWSNTAGELTKGRHESPNIVQITHINEVVVHCDLVDENYIAVESVAQQGFVLGSFYPKVPPGWKINEPSPHIIWQRVTVPEIRRIKIWLTDQDNKRINLRGEPFTVALLIRDVFKI